MIKIDLYINADGKSLKFHTDNNLNFIMSTPGIGDCVILENASYEFDGICDDDGRIHFLMQDSDGGLCYIKYDNNVWKKYNIFVSKEKKRSISDITLTEAGGMLCAFYIMKHSDKFMLIKHIFSADNLHMTPLVVDLTDSRKDFCICTGTDKNTYLYYRSEDGERCTVVYDRHFNEIRTEKADNDEDVFVQCVVNSGNKMYCLCSKAGKSYTSLVFSSADKKENEKIITFGIARNSRLSMNATGDKISLFWEEGNTIMHSESVNDGHDFSKPSFYRSKKEFAKIRYKGVKAGVYKSRFSLPETQFAQKTAQIQTGYSKKTATNGGRKNMSSNSIRDMDYVEFIHKLSEIEADIEKMSKDMDKICIFLDRLVQFKRESDNPKYSFNTEKPITPKGDIGEKNEENIKLFENLSIDEAIIKKNEINALQREGEMHVQPM